jgi:hypothetical protein
MQPALLARKLDRGYIVRQLEGHNNPGEPYNSLVEYAPEDLLEILNAGNYGMVNFMGTELYAL